MSTATLAANQGLYNGFLAAGLVWSIVADDVAFAVFFLLCVMVARPVRSFQRKTNAEDLI